MSERRYKQIRAAVALFVGITVSVAVGQGSMLLAGAGAGTGMLFLGLVRARTKIIIDEREETIREKAAQIAYGIFTPVIGLGSVLLAVAGHRLETAFLGSVGMVLSYLTLFLIATYSLAYSYLNKKLGGGSDEK